MFLIHWLYVGIFIHSDKDTILQDNYGPTIDHIDMNMVPWITPVQVG